MEQIDYLQVRGRGMFLRDRYVMIFATLVAAASPTKAFSEVVYTFENNGILDGDEAGDDAVFPPDSSSGVTGIVTTIEVVQFDGSTSGQLNENSGSLGISSDSGGNNAAFDGAEAWSFSWDVDTTLDFIDFDAFTSSETMTVQSTDWVGRTYTIESGRNLAFDSGLGRFTFGDDSVEGADAFSLTSIVSGDLLFVSAGTPYTLANGSAGDSAAIGELTFSASSSATAAPEPGSAVALLGLAGVAVAKRWRRKRRRASPV